MLAEAGDGGAGLGIGFVGEVVELLRVGGVVVELGAFFSFGPLGVAPAVGSDAAAHDGSFEALVGGAEDLGNGDAGPVGERIVEEGAKAAALEAFF